MIVGLAPSRATARTVSRPLSSDIELAVCDQMKTRKRNGLMFYSSRRLDAARLGVFGVELVDGHVRYVFGVMTDARRVRAGQRAGDDGGLRALTDHLETAVDDGRWHDVAVHRPLLGEHVLRVDGDVVQLAVEPLTHEFVRKVSSGKRQTPTATFYTLFFATTSW